MLPLQATLEEARRAELDVIIPDEIARPLVVSSHLMLATALLSVLRAEYGIAVTCVLVWVTSILHWRAPRYSSPRRYIDYIAVLVSVAYGSFLACTRVRRCGTSAMRRMSEKVFIACFTCCPDHDSGSDCCSRDWTVIWFGGLAGILFIFACNETAFYLQVSRSPTGNETLLTLSNPKCLPPTSPGSNARLNVYRRAVWVHLLCIHLLTNLLAAALVVWGLCGPTECAA